MPTTTNLAAITNGDLIPLLDDAGGGSYTQGRNNAKDIRQGLVNVLAAPNGGAYTRRAGVLPTTYNNSGKYWSDLRVAGQGSPSTSITLGAGQMVLPRTGQGYYLLSLTQDLTVALANADGANPRWDRLCLKGYDKEAFPGDAVHGPYLVAVYGDPAGSPSLPAIPTDSIEIARILRAAGSPGDLIGSGTAPITDMRVGTAMYGTPRVLLPGDALANAGGYHGEMRLRDENFVAAGLPAKSLVDRWSAVTSQWHGTTQLLLPQPSQTGFGSLGAGVTATIAQVTIPWPGWPYKVVVRAAQLGFFHASSVGLAAEVQVRVDSTTYATSGYVAWAKNTNAVGNVEAMVSTPGGSSAAITDGNSHVVSMICKNSSPGTPFTIQTGSFYAYELSIHPVGDG
ncbi:hypothetical protein [Kibdelosporangium phytohabitans]|uniref:Uncharacterized protein n=1 Tax=Kibdelosporangium phytohabitans TaxID=860235 RepID=A0A0N9HQ93_9PSEU|nr:hypothetical protein [Kibdelosporangium phytohabitans]ALG06856.1 hypothetical protein AOZ06_07845 [Kibdelosporangium phytohabitans]MBE1468103.1 hypothetical protein [Kibdelosporangium phytohabitans]